MFPDCHTSLRAARQSRPPRTSDFPLPRSPCFLHRLVPPHTTTSSSSRFSPRASSLPSLRLVPRIEKRPCPDSPASPSRSRPSPPRRPRRRCRPCTTRGQPMDTSQATSTPHWSTPTGYVRPSFFLGPALFYRRTRRSDDEKNENNRIGTTFVVAFVFRYSFFLPALLPPR